MSITRLCFVIVAGSALACDAQAAEFPTSRPPIEADVSVCFTPGENCEQEIVDAIAGGQDEIRVQAYDFTSTAILRALRDAIARGVRVRAILDRQDVKHFGAARYLALAGAEVWIDDTVAIAHNKLIIIDSWEVIGGSFNFTKSAQTRNAENLTFIGNPDVAVWYLANWDSRKAASQAYTP